MNKRSAFLSILGHLGLFALILLWGMKWPFTPQDMTIEKVDVIDNASFDALVAQTNPVVTPTPEPEISVIEDVAPEQNPAQNEEPIPVEIIPDNPPAPKPVEPVEPPKPQAPPIGEAAPRQAVAPPSRPNDLRLTEEVPQPQEPSTGEIDQLLEAVVGAVEAPAEPAPETQEPAQPAPETTALNVAPHSAPVPPARLETPINNTNPETIEPGTNVEPVTQTDTPLEPVPTEPTVTTQTPSEPTPAPDFVSKVGATNAPPSRDAGSLNVTDARPVAPAPEPEPEAPSPEASAEPSIDELVEGVAAEQTTPAETAPEAPAEPSIDQLLEGVTTEQTGETAAEAPAINPIASREISRVETGLAIQKISKNWNVASIADKPNLDQLIVKVKFTTDVGGQLAKEIVLLEPQNPSEDQMAAFRTADRAIRASLPLEISDGSAPDGVIWTLTFDPTGQNIGIN